MAADPYIYRDVLELAVVAFMVALAAVYFTWYQRTQWIHEGQRREEAWANERHEMEMQHKNEVDSLRAELAEVRRELQTVRAGQDSDRRTINELTTALREIRAVSVTAGGDVNTADLVGRNKLNTSPVG